MKQLHMYFTNEDGKQTNLLPKTAAPDLTAAQVKTFMEALIDLEAFEVKGSKKYTEIKSAKYVETITTHLL